MVKVNLDGPVVTGTQVAGTATRSRAKALSAMQPVVNIKVSGWMTSIMGVEHFYGHLVINIAVVSKQASSMAKVSSSGLTVTHILVDGNKIRNMDKAFR